MFEIQNGILIAYNGEEKDIVIPDGIKIIGKNAFEWCEDIVSVYIPDSVTEIEPDAFYGCKSLETVRFSANLARIGEYAFARCEDLKAISLPCFLEFIGDAAFEWCSIESITIPDAIDEISNSLFHKCRHLNHVKMNNNLRKIGKNAFASTAVEHIEIPDSVTEIQLGAFKNCVNLSSIVLPKSIKAIPDEAFNCTSLSAVEIPPDVSVIGKNAFRRCRLTRVHIPKNTIKICEGAFKLNRNLSVFFESPPDYVGKDAFPDCEPQKVKVMYSTSFRADTDRDACEEILVPKSVEHFIPDKFHHIVNLEKYSIKLFIGQGYFDGEEFLLQNGNLNLQKYDSLVDFADDNEKIYIALYRLAYDYELSDDTKFIYIDILQDNEERAALFATEHNDEKALKYIIDTGNLTAEYCDYLYDTAYSLKHKNLLTVITNHNVSSDPFSIFSFEV